MSVVDGSRSISPNISTILAIPGKDRTPVQIGTLDNWRNERFATNAAHLQ